MAFDITPAGLTTETQAEIRSRLSARLKAIFGEDLEDSSDSNNGQELDVHAENMALFQQATLGVYKSFDPAGAIGVSLDARRALTGSRRIAASRSTVTLSLTFTGAGAIAVGDTVRNDDENSLWDAIEDVTIPGAGTYEVRYQSQETGPHPALAGASWSQVDSVLNLSTIANAEDAELGQLVETDYGFRRRSQLEIFSSGQGPLSTIAARVSKVVGVTYVRVYHNPASPGADSDGIPFKAFNVVVITDPSVPGAALQQAIFDAIFSATGAGGQAYGTDYTGTSVDPEGVAQPVAFDTVDDLEVEVRVTLTTSTSEDAVTPNLAAVVKAAILAKALAEHQVPGRDVRAWDYTSVVGKLREDGLVTGIDAVVSEVRAVGDPTFVTTKRAVGIRQRAVFDSSRIMIDLA